MREIRILDGRVPVRIAHLIRIAILQLAYYLAVGRRDGIEVVDAIGQEGIVRSRTVGQARASAKYGLGVDLVCRTQTRSDCVRIVALETAVAAASAVAFVNHRSQPAAGVRVRSIERGVLH